jgi:hypothetical protein
VTPLDESARTLCLFFLGPWLEDSSSLEPLALERDLYTVAIVSMGISASRGTEIFQVKIPMVGLNSPVPGCNSICLASRNFWQVLIDKQG